MRLARPALAAAALACLAAACSPAASDSAPPPVALQGEVPQASLPQGTAPARTYANACGTCHDNGGYAVGVLADRLGPESALIHERNNLAPQTIRAVVRQGMGAMPAMSKIEVSDAELDEIIALLQNAHDAGGVQ